MKSLMGKFDGIQKRYPVTTTSFFFQLGNGNARYHVMDMKNQLSDMCSRIHWTINGRMERECKIRGDHNP